MNNLVGILDIILWPFTSLLLCFNPNAHKPIKQLFKDA